MHCEGMKADGTPCGAPASVVVDGYCPAHRPGASERMAEIGRKGAEATARRYRESNGMNPAELGRLETYDDALRWLELTGLALARGDINHREAQAMARLLAEWIRGNGDRLTSQIVEELEALKAQLPPKVA